MRLDNLFRAMGPIIATAAAGIAGNCRSDLKLDFNHDKAVPLGELDTSAGPIEELILIARDQVIITQGPEFRITVDGPAGAGDHLRFAISEGTLSISRVTGSTADIATIRISAPVLPRKLILAGSGHITTESLGGLAEVTLPGSGQLEVGRIETEQLDVTIAGSGRFNGAGTTERLQVSVLGSGTVALAELQAAKADTTIAGSGDVSFASDGDVDATIMGSGNITVHGNARCRMHGMGSGRVICERHS